MNHVKQTVSAGSRCCGCCERSRGNIELVHLSNCEPGIILWLFDAEILLRLSCVTVFLYYCVVYPTVSILPSGKGVVVDSTKAIGFEVVADAVYTLRDGCVMTVLKEGSSVIMAPGKGCSTPRPSPSGKTSLSSGIRNLSPNKHKH